MGKLGPVDRLIPLRSWTRFTPQFNIGDWVSAYVKYEEYYIYLPKTGVVSHDR